MQRKRAMGLEPANANTRVITLFSKFAKTNIFTKKCYIALREWDHYLLTAYGPVADEKCLPHLILINYINNYKVRKGSFSLQDKQICPSECNMGRFWVILTRDTNYVD